MITLAGVAIQSKIYESPVSLVYRGIREQDNQALVIKLLKQDYPSSLEIIRYRQEYQITHSLNLEGVVRVYSQQDYQRTLVMLLEDFGGESLQCWIEQRPESFCPMPLSNFLRLAIALTDTLGKIHAANVIHKDLNPGNIVLNLNTGVVKIIDFGIATRFSRTNPMFKSPHVLEGTLAYLSPEQTGRMNRLLDYRTDFYSLGVTFYQLLTGELPFPTTDALELVHCHLAKQPVPPEVRGVKCEVRGGGDESSSIANAIPEAVSDIVMKLMAKNAEDRYQSARGIKADLEHCLHQLESTEQISAIQLGLQDVSEQFQIPQKLYGREAEIEALLAAFERATGRGDDGKREEGERENVSVFQRSSVATASEILLVSGYSGIGKSALVQELYKPITAKRGYFVSGKFDQFQRYIPYSAIAQALQKLVQQLLGEPDDQLQQWRSRLLAALSSNGQIIVDVIPEVELIIGKQPPVPDIGVTEAQNRFNRVFQQFVRVFCSKEHPLVIFLDDLQWIDSATLKLIELIVLNDQTQYLFLIGAYRDNEVNLTHPLILMLEQLRKQGIIPQGIALAPLTLEPLCRLIADTLHQTTDAVRPLAQLVLRKTEGNPFFVSEFLRMLYRENLLTLDAKHLSWRWNVAQIQAQNITENVAELLLRQLKELPENTQHILRLAACVGAEFDLDTLAIVCKQTPEVVSLDLLAAIQAGLIQPLSELDENLLVQEYKFLHDRIQQAAYALIDEAQKQVVHLQNGRNLLEKILPERRSSQLFKIVDHLNYGIELVPDQGERDEIARLNLLAGQKAKAAIAYSTAKNYLAIGRRCLAASSWQTNYELSLALYTETTEVAYLCGEFEQVEHWGRIVLQEAKTVLDIVKVYEVKIQTNMAQGEPSQAINIGLQVLQQLGISLPEQPSQLDIQLELDIIASLLSDKCIEDLVHLPGMTELDKLAAIRILSSITITAQIATPDLVPLLVSKQVNLSIQYGNTLVSPFAYALYGFTLCGMVGDIESGYEFGQLALRLLSQLHTHSLRARTLYIVNTYIVHWKEHIKETSKRLLEAYQTGLETGDLEFAGYCAQGYCSQSFMAGRGLVELEREMGIYSEAIRRISQQAPFTWIQIYRQSALNLMGRAVNPIRLIGEAYNEESRSQNEISNTGAIFLIRLHKLFLCYLFSEYTQALESLIIAESHLTKRRGAYFVSFCSFYSSLVRLATFPEGSAQVQEEILKKVAISQEEMKRWAQCAPMNYLHKYHLVEAEKARVLGQVVEAMDFYELAIKGAKDNEYTQEEALGYELAAKFYLARGMEKFAQTYMKEAHYCYGRWEATAKVKHLETCYPQFFPQSVDMASMSIPKASGNTSNVPPIAFDLATVMKASQTISREIELEQLLRSLMQILIENAGAQTGCLILENLGEWTIEVACELNEGEEVCATQVLQSIPIVNRLPEAIIQYVIRTHESVILNDATREGNFISDPYIQQNQTQSLLCLPLLNQSQLVGVLYLENQLATGVFTPDRSQLLNLLSTQAAIAIENAKLYSKLRASESRMAQFLEAVPVGITVVDAAGHPYYFNQQAVQLLGKGAVPSITLDQLTEIYQGYIAGTNQKYPTEKLTLFRALRGERTRTDDLEIHQESTVIPLEVWGTPVFDEHGNVTYAIAAFQDITERKQAEHFLANYNLTLEQQVAERTAALQESEAALRDVYDELRLREQQLRLITDALPVCISYIDANQRYQFVNQTYEDWFSCSRDQILGKHTRELLGETAYEVAQPYINRALTGQTTIYEVEIPYPFGKRYVSGSLIPDFDSNAQVRGYYGLITDISEQRNTALRERKRAEAASILEERNRMAREIHDTLAQAFTGILLHIGAATQVLADDLEATQSHLEMIDELARTGLAEARRSVTALRPHLLEGGNLPDALHHLVTQMRSATDTALRYETKGTAYPLPAEVENNLLRIGQEALTNAIRYADASEIQVDLVYDHTQCVLRVKDDGRGFGVGSIPPVNGFGLLGMSERAVAIGAQLTIGSQPGQGTEIVIVVNREQGS
ncbi:AAA family ATPase [Leptolyngbya sp. FACHB-671]|uniref:AAA family ATPase n=1 Tax=Leptolyngbya sp. FACHB-671 TaxID=2692812 RepID=UPI001683AA6D|nr:AAA family ATPase [Leptolyngbya sp. FACHB-671]MBD2068016.1 AAA family ATPase [Leptolyngbya sp. FACHB-671]